MGNYTYMELWDMPNVEMSKLVGKVFTSIDVGDDSITFKANDGSEYVMWHNQDCCENVYVESVVGDIIDLIGNPILLAEVVSQNETPKGISDEELSTGESFTWTFYKLATIKGHVDIRWFGSSNGYYSERVNLVETKDAKVE